jgi:hypothetical protein
VPIGQGAKGRRQRFPGFSAHDHRLAERRCAKIPQVFGQQPEQLLVFADRPVAGNSGNQGDHHPRSIRVPSAQTAT